MFFSRDYFDEVGALVAYDLTSDTPEFCDGRAFRLHAGPEMSCALVVTEAICEPGANRADGGV